MDKRRRVVSQVFVKIFVSKYQKNRREPFCVSEKVDYGKNLRIIRGISLFSAINFCPKESKIS